MTKPQWGRKECVGAALLVVMLVANLVVQRNWGWQEGAAMALVVAQCAGIATALGLMGVVRPRSGPLTYLLPGTLAVLYFALAAVQTATTPRSELWQTYRPTGFGLLLIASTLGLGVWSAVQRRRWAEFDARQAAGLFAALMLAGLSWAIKSNMGRVAHPGSENVAYALLMRADLLYAVLLLPLLSKSARGGKLLFTLGVLFLATGLLGENIRALRFLQLLMPDKTIYIAFIIGGLWCALPAPRGVDKAERRAYNKSGEERAE